MAKAALLFLLGMVLVALFSRAIVRPKRPKNRLAGPGTCPRCGAYLIGRGPCACEKRKA